jgi:hypothetical protein
MEANNVLLLSAGMRRDDGPDPINSQGIAIKSDQVDGVRHSQLPLSLATPTNKHGEVLNVDVRATRALAAKTALPDPARVWPGE